MPYPTHRYQDLVRSGAFWAVLVGMGIAGIIDYLIQGKPWMVLLHVVSAVLCWLTLIRGPLEKARYQDRQTGRE